MVKEEALDVNIDMRKNIISSKIRADHLSRENARIEQEFSSRELFWDNQKQKFDKMITSLNIDAGDVRRGFSENALYTEKIITDFRNRVKTDRLDSLKKGIELWKLEEFVTQKRFKELLSSEIKSVKRKEL